MDCQCHCNGKCGLLGGLEQKVADVVWQSDKPLRPADVRARISTPYAYTTIMTILRRLTDKGLLSRRLKGRVYYYSPTIDQNTYTCSCLDDLFCRLLESYGQTAVDRFQLALKSHPVK